MWRTAAAAAKDVERDWRVGAGVTTVSNFATFVEEDAMFDVWQSHKLNVTLSISMLSERISLKTLLFVIHFGNETVHICLCKNI